MMLGKNGNVITHFTKKWQGSLLVTHIPSLDPVSGSTHRAVAHRAETGLTPTPNTRCPCQKRTSRHRAPRRLRNTQRVSEGPFCRDLARLTQGPQSCSTELWSPAPPRGAPPLPEKPPGARPAASLGHQVVCKTDLTPLTNWSLAEKKCYMRYCVDGTSQGVLFCRAGPENDGHYF